MSTILVVDDVQTDRELVGKVVNKAGHNAAYAADGDEAITKAKSIKPSLIFLDVVMGKVNGFQTCRTLKTDPETSAIPVVLVTSKSTESDKFWGRKQGADDHIAKPFTADALLEVIRRFVR
jgi:twitching motility two-component system response regulator PilH